MMDLLDPPCQLRLLYTTLCVSRLFLGDSVQETGEDVVAIVGWDLVIVESVCAGMESKSV